MKTCLEDSCGCKVILRVTSLIYSAQHRTLLSVRTVQHDLRLVLSSGIVGFDFNLEMEEYLRLLCVYFVLCK